MGKKKAPVAVAVKDTKEHPVEQDKAVAPMTTTKSDAEAVDAITASLMVCQSFSHMVRQG
jgi:hypothetical protein